ncbi:Nicotinamidase-related amidase [Klenkia soli]|uniref:Nicotinamidase-related amidase n=1 Tax=Klenkia soli TaxID=1052260 RepID=A0A1H0EQW3_9ACTN|nr:isochorismatase family protein [Klenkia soli]SDN84750.1 Nicotinamidase-related amidase [Klenkia soli]
MTAEAVRVGMGRLDTTDRPGLVLVDCQNLFTLDPAVDAAAKACGRAAAAAREAGVPVVWLRVLFDDDAELGPVWTTKAPALKQLRPGAELAEFDPRVGYVDGEPVVTKKRASGFVRTELDDLLHDLDVHTLAVAGFTTAGCVRATVVDAASLDYAPVVLADAVADRSTAIHDAALVDLDARYADVVPSTDDWFRTVRSSQR